jgi:hypothetical protein
VEATNEVALSVLSGDQLYDVEEEEDVEDQVKT